MDMKAAKEPAIELPIIEYRLRRAGLYSTASEMNKAVQKIGFEIAGKIELTRLGNERRSP